MNLNRFSRLFEPDNTILFPESCPQFLDLSSSEVLKKIEEKIINLHDLIENDVIPFLDIPLRRRENIVYDDKGRLFLGKKTIRVEMYNEYNEFAKIIGGLNILYEVLMRDIHSTKRDIFYQHIKLFQNQRASDNVIDSLATWLGCSRYSLNVTASSKGVVVGHLDFKEKGDFIDCRKIGSGKSITPNIKDISEVQGDAEFILLVEKDAIFNRLAEDQFYNTIPSIIITAKGQPDLATRAFIKKLVTELEIPVFGLMDSDVYGLSILSTYAKGSVQMAYETTRICHNNMYWLGLRPSQIENYGIPSSVLLNLTQNDRVQLSRMMIQPNFKCNKKIIEEMGLMLEMGAKAEIQALNAQDPQYITNEYLPQALDAGDFIKF